MNIQPNPKKNRFTLLEIIAVEFIEQVGKNQSFRKMF